jgi:hypothetical protein
MKAFVSLFSNYLVFGLCFLLFFLAGCGNPFEEENSAPSSGQVITPIDGASGSGTANGAVNNEAIVNYEQLKAAFNSASIGLNTDAGNSKFVEVSNELQLGGLLTRKVVTDYLVSEIGDSSATLIVEGMDRETVEKEAFFNRLFNPQLDGATAMVQFFVTSICLPDRIIKGFRVIQQVTEFGEGYIPFNRTYPIEYVLSLDERVPLLANPLVEMNPRERIYNQVVSINGSPILAIGNNCQNMIR